MKPSLVGDCIPAKQLESSINYLTFDQTKKKITKLDQLDLNNPSVLTSVQNLLLNEILPRYSFSDYTQTPIGPLAIIMQSVDMPNTLNNIRDKINSLIFQSNINAENNLNMVLDSRIEQLLKNSIVNSGTELTFKAISDLKAKVTEFKRISSNFWKLDEDKKFDSFDSIDKSLEYLKKKVDGLKGNLKFLK